MGQELVADGGFEGAVWGGCPNACTTSCGFSINPWTRIGGSIMTDLLLNNPPSQCTIPNNPAGGTYFVSLQGSVCCGCNNNGGVRQAVATVQGETYTLSADLYLDEWDAIDVSCAGASIQFDASNTPTMQWTRVTWTFVAGAAADLSLNSVGIVDTPVFCISADYCHIDNISLVEFVPPPPAPCPADLNADGVVDAVDLAALLGAWGECR